MRKSLLLFTLINCLATVHAQNNSFDFVRQQLVNEFILAKTLTVAYLNAMPEDKYSFRPQDSIRSFAQQMLHLAQVNAAMVANGTGAERLFPRGFNLEQRSGAQNKDTVMHYVSKSFDFSIDAIRNMNAATLGEKIKDKDKEEARLAWLFKALVHLAHHRGQTVVYFRLAAVAPPKWIE